MTQIDLENTIAPDAETDINKICQPLFERFDITYFDYARFYSDNTMTLLINNCEWGKLFLNDPMFKPPPRWIPEGFHLWSSYIPEHFLRIARDDFNILHGVTIIKHYPDYQQVINFAAAPDQVQVLAVYLNNQVILNSFIRYFEEKAKKYIQVASRIRIILPSTMTKDDVILETPNYDSFLHEISKTQTFSIVVDDMKIRLTKREAECLYHLMLGKSMKMIARELDISPRTVECYINNLRTKTGAITKYNLIDKIKNKDEVESWQL